MPQLQGGPANFHSTAGNLLERWNTLRSVGRFTISGSDLSWPILKDVMQDLALALWHQGAHVLEVQKGPDGLDYFIMFHVMLRASKSIAKISLGPWPIHFIQNAEAVGYQSCSRILQAQACACYRHPLRAGEAQVGKNPSHLCNFLQLWPWQNLSTVKDNFLPFHHQSTSSHGLGFKKIS